MELTIEIEGEGKQPPLPGHGAALVAFMSFAVVRGFGAQHPYIAIADRLHDEYGLRLGPVTTFYEGTVEDAEDEQKLEMAWQSAAELAESLETMNRALAAPDSQLCALLERANAGTLPSETASALEIARRATASGKRVRLSYTL